MGIFLIVSETKELFPYKAVCLFLCFPLIAVYEETRRIYLRAILFHVFKVLS